MKESSFLIYCFSIRRSQFATVTPSSTTESDSWTRVDSSSPDGPPSGRYRNSWNTTARTPTGFAWISANHAYRWVSPTLWQPSRSSLSGLITLSFASFLALLHYLSDKLTWTYKQHTHSPPFIFKRDWFSISHICFVLFSLFLFSLFIVCCVLWCCLLSPAISSSVIFECPIILSSLECAHRITINQTKQTTKPYKQNQLM